VRRNVSAGAVVLALVVLGTIPFAQAQKTPAVAGMWSGVLNGAIEDMFCDWGWCTDVGRERLAALLDDPSNDERLTILLFGDAARYQLEQYVIPRLTPAGRATLGVDPAEDPGFLLCEPWGFARQIFAPHQLQITELDDRVEFHYGTWDARRTIWLADDKPPRDGEAEPSRLGFSVGRYEGRSLVVETSGIAANFAPWGWNWSDRLIDGKHSDQLRSIERYSRSEDGDRLLLTVTFDDPWSMSEPLVLKRVWSAAPDERIYPDADCERPIDFLRK
jgi:hypothetical protein